MVKDILLEVLTAASLFFLNPLFVATLIAAVFLGYMRVKRERRSFRVRLMPGFTELKRLLSESWPYAIILSILISGVGLVVDSGWLVLFCIAAFIGLFSFYYKVMSPIYFVAVAFFTIYFLERYASNFVFRGWSPTDVDLFGDLAITVAIIAGLLLVTEGILISRFGDRDASPFLKKTKRGLHATVFKTKRLWLLPVIFLVPGELVVTYLPYWPQFTLGQSAFTFIPVPLIIGFSQVIRSSYPNIIFPKIGSGVIAIGTVVVALGVSSIWLPILGVVAILVGVVGRVVFSVVISLRERSGAFIVAPKSKGVVIAGVLPESPGDKMGLLPGECIRSVNGLEVTNEKELYDAIQINAAHCRLQVLGRDGEVRLMQQVIYRHDHHRLGILVIR